MTSDTLVVDFTESLSSTSSSCSVQEVTEAAPVVPIDLSRGKRRHDNEHCVRDKAKSNKVIDLTTDDFPSSSHATIEISRNQSASDCSIDETESSSVGDTSDSDFLDEIPLVYEVSIDAAKPPNDTSPTRKVGNTNQEDLRVPGETSKYVVPTGQVPVGTRVYANWEFNNLWYYGTVVGSKMSEGCWYHHIRFDDGDERKSTPLEQFVIPKQTTANEKAKYITNTVSKTTRVSVPCGTCNSCLSMPCSRCHGCRNMDRCFHQMCSILDDEYKKLPLPLLGDDWFFVFNSCKFSWVTKSDKLCIYSPRRRSYNSVEGAVYACRKAFSAVKVDIDEVCQYLGIVSTSTESIRPAKSIRLAKSKNVSKKRRSLKTTKSTNAAQDKLGANRCAVGSRVYARYHSDNWYWGTITAMSSGTYFTCAVLFDEGDKLNGLQFWEVLSTDEYCYHMKSQPPATKYTYRCIDVARDTQSIDIGSLHQEHCVCGQCIKKDCGTCSNCKDNSESTRPQRQRCLFKVCEMCCSRNLAQIVPCLKKWNFYFKTIPLTSSLEQKNSVSDERLRGLTFVSTYATNVFNSIEQAAKFEGHDGHAARKIAKDFYEKQLGILYRKERSHVLVGQYIFHHWLGIDRHPKSVNGVVEKCFSLLETSEEKNVFIVKYDPRFLKRPSNVMQQRTEKELTDEEVWGAYKLAHEDADVSSSVSCVGYVKPFHWLLPKSVIQNARSNNSPPSLQLLHNGFVLTFEIRDSLIPNAGKGVFVSCEPFVQSVNMYNPYVLATGEFLDLGIYAPHRKDDIKKKAIFVLKCFIFEMKPESWCFDTEHFNKQGDQVYDITDDNTGDLHELAKNSVLSYVNEINSNEQPSIHTRYDPDGCMHYLLGHSHGEGSCDFRLYPCNEAIELKTNYLHSYEKVRIRKGYSRYSDAELKLAKMITHDDYEILKDILRWNANDTSECVDFLECLDLKQNCEIDVQCRVRCFAVTLQIVRRLYDINSDFKKATITKEQVAVEMICDNGFTTLDVNSLINRGKLFAKKLYSLWSKKKEIKLAILSSKILRYVMTTAVLGREDPNQLDDMDDGYILGCIQDKELQFYKGQDS